MPLQKGKIVFQRLGNLSESEFAKCVDFHSKLLRKKNYTYKSQRLIMNSMIECFHNVITHGWISNNLLNEMYFRTTELTDYFLIETCNYLKSSVNKDLMKSLDSYEKLNRKQLKELYFNKLSEGLPSNSPNSNLGLLLLFLNSDVKLNYAIAPIGNNYTKLNLSIKIKTKTNNEA